MRLQTQIHTRPGMTTNGLNRLGSDQLPFRKAGSIIHIFSEKCINGQVRNLDFNCWLKFLKRYAVQTKYGTNSVYDLAVRQQCTRGFHQASYNTVVRLSSGVTMRFHVLSSVWSLKPRAAFSGTVIKCLIR